MGICRKQESYSLIQTTHYTLNRENKGDTHVKKTIHPQFTNNTSRHSRLRNNSHRHSLRSQRAQSLLSRNSLKRRNIYAHQDRLHSLCRLNLPRFKAYPSSNAKQNRQKLRHILQNAEHSIRGNSDFSRSSCDKQSVHLVLISFLPFQKYSIHLAERTLRH